MERTKIGRKIKEIRNQKKLSQEELVNISGVSYTTITKIESGVIKNPSIDKITLIAKALGVSIEDLTMPRNAGKDNIRGIKAQVWAAASMFFQHLLFNDFEKIELEAALFEDFNLVFKNDKRLIVEVKLRNDGFSLDELLSLYKKLIKKGGIKNEDEILIIAKNFNKDILSILGNYKYFAEPYKDILSKAGFKLKHLELIKRTKYWHIDFESDEAEESAFYMFTKLIDYAAPLDDMKRLFESTILQKFFIGSAKGNTYAKLDFLNEIQENKLSIVRKDGTFSSEISSLDQQLDMLRSECNKVESSKASRIFTDNVISAASTNPTIMHYILTKLEMFSNLNLSLVQPILNLNRNYQYSFSTGRILKQNLNDRNNINIVIEYIKANLSPLIFIRGDWFWISDFIDIANQIIDFDNAYSEQIVPLIIEILNKSESKYLYFKQENRSYEIGNLIGLAIKILNIVNVDSKKLLFETVLNHFTISHNDYHVNKHDKANLYLLIERYLSSKHNNYKDITQELIEILVKDYKKGFQRLSSKLKFKGYEVMSGMSSWHGDEYEVGDKEFIKCLLTPVLRKFLKRSSSEFWLFVQEDIMGKDINENNPDFVRRALIPIFIENYFNGESSIVKKVRNYLEILILDDKNIPIKSSLIFQIVYKNNFDGIKVWDLLRISLNANQLPTNPFIEILTRHLVDSEDNVISNTCESKLFEWIASNKYREISANWNGQMVNNLDKLLEKSPKKAITLFKKVIDSGYLNTIDIHEVYKYSDLVRGIIKSDFRKGYIILKPIINKKTLTTNEQIFILDSFHSITDRETYTSEYLLDIYEQFVTPLLNKCKSIDVLVKRYSNSNARETFINIAESILRSESIEDRVGKGVSILKFFMKDPDPYMPGEDPNDPYAKSSIHKRILEGQDEIVISSVRGKVAYSLGISIFGDSREHIQEIMELCSELVQDKNYHVYSLLSHTIRQLGTARFWIMPEDSNELFLSANKETALKLAKNIESIAFKYLQRLVQMTEQVQKALARNVALAFNSIHALNSADVTRFLNLIGDLTPEVIYNFASFYVYYAFYRKNQFKKWNHKLKGLYDDLSPELFDEPYFFKLLLDSLKQYGTTFQNEIIYMLDDLKKDCPEKLNEIRRIIEVVIEDFNVEKFGNLFRFIDNQLEGDFEFALDIYKKVIIKQNASLKLLSTEEIKELRQLNYYYDVDVLLRSIYDRKGEEEFLKTIELIFDVPVTIYIYKLKEIDDILKKLSKTELADKVFKVLYEKVDVRYFDMYRDWKSNVND